MKAGWLVLAVGLAACSKDEGGASAAEGTTSSTKAEEAKGLSEAQRSIVDAWKKQGLEPSELTATKGFGKDCSAGTVDKIEVVICEFASEAEAKKAEQPGLDWVGSTTGAAWTAGSLVIAVADRKKSDPHGKTINQLMKSTPK